MGILKVRPQWTGQPESGWCAARHHRGKHADKNDLPRIRSELAPGVVCVAPLPCQESLVVKLVRDDIYVEAAGGETEAEEESVAFVVEVPRELIFFFEVSRDSPKPLTTIA